MKMSTKVEIDQRYSHSHSNMKRVRKITVINFKGTPSVSQAQADEEWKELTPKIHAILKSNQNPQFLEEMYRSVENLCTHNYGKFLFENFYYLLENYLTYELLPSICEETHFLESLNEAWMTFSRRIVVLINVFIYLDRTYVLKTQRLQTLMQTSLNLFKECVVKQASVRGRMMRDLLRAIYRERSGEASVRNDLMKSCTGMLNTLQVYSSIFEMSFLCETEDLYKAKGIALISEGNFVKYLKSVEHFLMEEHERVVNYLHKQTDVPLKECLIGQLLTPHLSGLLDKGVNDLLENGLLEETALLYKLAGLLPTGRTELCASFGCYLKNRGRLIVIDPENDKGMIRDLLDFKDKIDGVVNGCFERHPIYVETVKDAFKFFVNQRYNAPSMLLAKFVDGIMRSKELGEDEIEEFLQKVMVLFRFVQGKDVFEAFYKRYMAKRLLVGKSANQDSENSMISKLKAECGGCFTSRLEGMVKDMTLSQGIQSAFRQYLNHQQSVGDGSNLCIDMVVNILTSSYWPTYPSYDINLPSEMATYQNTFQTYYMQNHSGRKLLWQPNLGYCIVRASFATCNKELQLSLFQATVMLLFNNANSLSYKEIRDAINLEDDELKRTLQSLACGKTRVLHKNPRGKDVNDNDVFDVNDHFADKLFRVKINQVQMKETAEEARATEKSIIQDRQFQIDAAIVRIMKQKKIFSHNLLIGELYASLDIPIKSADLKKRIEQLIERDYIERDRNDSNVYKYIA